MEFVALFFDLVKGIAWPLALAVMIVVFRAELRELLPRVRRAGPTGVEIAEQAHLKVSKWSGTLKELTGVKRTELIARIEHALHKELQAIPDAERVDLLVNRLSVARISTVFERVYGAIFGSQIAGLRALAGGSGIVPLSDAVKFFDEFKSKTPALAPVEFDQWVGFLKNFELVRVENDWVSITDMGRDFLLYMSLHNLNESKAL